MKRNIKILTVEEVNELSEMYWSLNYKNKEIIDKYNIDISYSMLSNIVNPKLDESKCSYCNVNLYRKPKKDMKGDLFCKECNHTIYSYSYGRKCSCINCQKIYKEERKQAEKESLEEYIRNKNEILNIINKYKKDSVNFGNLSLLEVLVLYGLFTYHKNHKRNYKLNWSPSEHFTKKLMNTLWSLGIVRVKIDDIKENYDTWTCIREIVTRSIFGKYIFIDFSVISDNDLFNKEYLLDSLKEKVKNSNDQFRDIMISLAVEDAYENYIYHLKKYDLDILEEEKRLREIILYALEKFSLAQLRYIVKGSVNFSFGFIKSNNIKRSETAKVALTLLERSLSYHEGKLPDVKSYSRSDKYIENIFSDIIFKDILNLSDYSRENLYNLDIDSNVDKTNLLLDLDVL